MRKKTKYFAPLTRKINVWLTEEWYEKIKKAADSRGMNISDLARRRLLGIRTPAINLGLITALNDLRNAANKHAGLFKQLYNLNHVYSKETAAGLAEATKLYARVVKDYDTLRETLDEEIMPEGRE